MDSFKTWFIRYGNTQSNGKEGKHHETKLLK